MSETGVDKSAALLLALGEEASAAVLRYLSPLDVSRLGMAMRALDVLPRERVRAVLRDYAAEAAEQTGFAADTGRFLDEALKRAWPPERARAMLRRLGASSARALDALGERTPAEIAGLLDGQPSYLVAAVMAHLPRDVAAATLDLLPAGLRADTLRDLAQRESPTADMLHELDDWLAERAATEPEDAGEATVANLLDRMSEGAAAAALAQLDRDAAGLAARLRARVLEFDDLARATEDGRRTFLRNVGARALLHALKGSDGRVYDALAAVMSPAAALRMKDDLDTLGAVPVAEIQAAQHEAAQLLRRLAAEGAVRFEEMAA
ncbi:flagellar motor switch protein FliG [Betaproteobacteria bacterium SCN1]|jgi:flagellar motor switch protein FliG|nr:flagellar motor switch protein FliG [Betaproteobacteria bacterium SCN1]MBN8759654.1 flagellar motor switch protein FliG [Thiobacillus sp.]ODU89875.1 MAG: flagellar motor switch protein FliG [Thiobacillus sp. SCN 65-179]OJW37569.1 MAG: flagellar motor switch protein FliG [Thiobacillus sp. 65-69]